MDPSIQPPYQTPPQMQPPYQQPPRRKLTTGTLVGILFGVVALIAVITTILLVAHDEKSDISHRDTSRLNELAPPDQDPEKNPANIGPTKSYKNSRISFSYPHTMTQKDTSNITVITPDGSPSDRQAFTSDSSSTTNDAIINYSGQWSDNPTPVDKSRRIEAMKQGVEAQKNASERETLSMRASTAHGCASNFSYTSRPELVEHGDIVGMKYGYTCTSYYGNVQGEYFVWYDAYGSKHSLTVDALTDYWRQHQVDLQAITASVVLLSTGSTTN